MLSLRYVKYDLFFRKPAITSRDTMLYKPSWVFVLEDDNIPDRIFHGEVSVILGLSIDNLSNIEKVVSEICSYVNMSQILDHDFNLNEYPAIAFGFEMLIRDYHAIHEKIMFSSHLQRELQGSQ